MALLELLIRPLCSGVGYPLTSFQIGGVIDGSWYVHAQGRVSNSSAAKKPKGEGGLLNSVSTGGILQALKPWTDLLE